jgi:hypothetical protein
VYLGEHYAVDLAGGVALAAAVRAVEPALAPAAGRMRRAVGCLEAIAHGAP